MSAVLLDDLLAARLELVAGKLEEHEADDGIAVLFDATDTPQGNATVPENVLESPLLLLLGGFCPYPTLQVT